MPYQKSFVFKALRSNIYPASMTCVALPLQHLDNYRRIPVLAFDEAAAAVFQRLRRTRLRIGTMDLKIAAIVLSRDATLLSRNLADFRQVPGLRVEDWTA
jgi:tRNA(fMet)-specific endonuclease VapC